MTKTPKDYDKIISVLFPKVYVGLKSISCITSLAGLVASQVASQSEGPRFESHANLFQKKKKTFLYYSGENLSVLISLGCKLSHVLS